MGVEVLGWVFFGGVFGLEVMSIVEIAEFGSRGFEGFRIVINIRYFSVFRLFFFEILFFKV